MLEVKCEIHNHPLAKYLEGQSYVSRLTTVEEEFVVDMSKVNAPTKDVLNMRKQ